MRGIKRNWLEQSKYVNGALRRARTRQMWATVGAGSSDVLCVCRLKGYKGLLFEMVGLGCIFVIKKIGGIEVCLVENC